MKTGLTFEELEKIEPPFFIKSYQPQGLNKIYLNYDELGIDEEGKVYVEPALELSFNILIPSGKYQKEKAEANPFFYGGMPREPWPSSKQWHLLAAAKHIDKIKVFKGQKYFHLLIKHIFGDKK